MYTGGGDTVLRSPVKTHGGVCHQVSQPMIVYYETIKREIQIRCMYECRCDERLQTKVSYRSMGDLPIDRPTGLWVGHP